MKKIVISGLCSPDAQRLYSELKTIFDTEVIWIETFEKVKEYLGNGGEVSLIIASRIGHEDQESGLDLLKFVKDKKIKVPIVVLTGIEKHQKSAIKRGAAFSFDLELLIGFLGPERQSQKEEVIGKLKEILGN
jgi:hypothetical protein